MLPKFNFANSDIKTTDQLNKEVEENDKRNKFFRPGQYELRCVDVAYQGQSDADKTWSKVLVTWEGAGGRTMTDQLLIPTTKLKITTRNGESLFAFKNLQSFMDAIGVVLTVENVGDILTQWFTDPTKTLKGVTVSVDIGYRGNYVNYEGKSADGATRYSIKLANGSSVLGSDNTAVILPDYNAAAAYAEKHEIAVERFTRILQYKKSLNTSTLKSVSNW